MNYKAKSLTLYFKVFKEKFSPVLAQQATLHWRYGGAMNSHSVTELAGMRHGRLYGTREVIVALRVARPQLCRIHKTMAADQIAAYGQTTLCKTTSSFGWGGLFSADRICVISDNNLLEMEKEIRSILISHKLSLIDKEFASRLLPQEVVKL